MRLAYKLLPALAGISLLAVGCEPASITEARDQLGRGTARSVTYAMPLARDTFYIDSLLGDDTTRTADGRRAVTIDPETLAVAVGEKLKFDAITLSQLNIDLPTAPFVPASGSYSIPDQTYNAGFASEPRLNAIDTVVADSGTLTITTRSRLERTTISYTLTLNGFKDSLGVPLSRSGTIPAAPGPGTFGTDILTFNLRGVTIVPANVAITVSGATATWSSGGPNTSNPDDIIQTSGGNIVVRRLAGTLDPATTPELNVAVDEAEEIAIEVDSLFGDFADALEDARLNDVVMGLTVRNGLGTKLTLNNFRLGVVELTAAGAVPRDGGGNPVFQKDSLNNPIQASIVDTGQTTLTVLAAPDSNTPRVKSVALQVAPVIDRVIDLLLQNKRAGLVAVGTTTAGDAAVKSRVSRTDSVSLTLAMTVALDITVPTSGVTFDDTQVQEGLDLDSADANQIASRVESASARSVVINQTPFGVQVRIALVPDSQPPNVDADSIFRMSNRIELTPVDLSPAQVHPDSGYVTQAVTDTVSVSMTGQQSRVLFRRRFTAALRVTLLPNASAGGRGAIRPSDRVIVNAGASVTIRLGGN